MIIKEIEGNLLQLYREGAFPQGIAQGCNCYHVMGAGVAGQIADQFPEAVAKDRETQARATKLGLLSKADIPGLPPIYNLYTQRKPGREEHKFLYHGIKFAFLNLDMMFSSEFWQGPERPVIGIPAIGSGIAGGDWDSIQAIINSTVKNINLVLVKYVP